MKSLILFLFAASALAAPEVLRLEGDIEGVHDPVIIKDGATYYVFSTGGRPNEGVIPIRTSQDHPDHLRHDTCIPLSRFSATMHTETTLSV